MDRIVLHPAKLICLLLVAGLFSPGSAAFSAPMSAEEDSVRVEELIILDTLHLKIDGPSNDVAFYMNGLIFLSNTKYHQSMIPEHITFGQIRSYLAPLEYLAIESSKPLFPNDPFPYSPAGMSFTRDYRKVYFTKKVGISGRRSVEKIFEMSIINGAASRHNQLSFTGDPSRYMHPAIAVDESFLIFASDRSPSNGGLDLFIVRNTETGWSAPVNLGPGINTSSHEWYPFLDQYHNLYFSSSGHMGFGGYDIYVCFYNGSGWGEPQNLSELINSDEDELGFSIHPNRKMALYSTSSGGESQSGKIFKLSLNNKAFLLAGIDDTRSQDISLLFKDLTETGYTSSEFSYGAELIEEKGFELTALPLLSESPQEPEPEPEPAVQKPESEVIAEEPKPEPVTIVPEPEPLLIAEEPQPEPVMEEPEPVLEAEDSEPEIQIEAAEPVVEETETQPEPEPEIDPNRVVFRVQILSVSTANSRSSVTIEGTSYDTWEYFYKGAYRITVGEFYTVQEALAFRTLCKNAGFNQAFVAAFRNNERELDPAVFKR